MSDGLYDGYRAEMETYERARTQFGHLSWEELVATLDAGLAREYALKAQLQRVEEEYMAAAEECSLLRLLLYRQALQRKSP